MDLSLVILGIIVFTLGILTLAKLVHIPLVIALLGETLLFSIPIIRDFTIGPNEETILLLGDLGIISLMFIAGLHISKNDIIKEINEAFYISLGAFFTPLLLGTVVFYAIGVDFLEALMIGLCMSISAEATTTKFLLDIKKINTRIGSLLIDAGVIDDVMGVLSLSILSLLFASQANHELLLLALTIFAFALGIIIHKRIPKDILKTIEKTLNYAFVPFFFISMALHLEFTAKINILVTLLVILIAMLGKILGTFFAGHHLKLTKPQLLITGWGLNSRGAIGLVIATIGVKLSLLSHDYYSSIVIMAMVTTILFPFMIKHILKKHPNAME